MSSFLYPFSSNISSSVPWQRIVTTISPTNSGDDLDMGTGRIKHGAAPPTTGTVALSEGDSVKWLCSDGTHVWNMQTSHALFGTPSVVDELFELGYNVQIGGPVDATIQSGCFSIEAKANYGSYNYTEIYWSWTAPSGIGGASTRPVAAQMCVETGLSNLGLNAYAICIGGQTFVPWAYWSVGGLTMQGGYICQGTNNAAMILGTKAGGASTFEMLRASSDDHIELGHNGDITRIVGPLKIGATAGVYPAEGAIRTAGAFNWDYAVSGVTSHLLQLDTSANIIIGDLAVASACLIRGTYIASLSNAYGYNLVCDSTGIHAQGPFEVGGPVKLSSYTKAALLAGTPSATVAGKLAWCSDDIGGACPVVSMGGSDGDWHKIAVGAVIS